MRFRVLPAFLIVGLLITARAQSLEPLRPLRNDTGASPAGKSPPRPTVVLPPEKTKPLKLARFEKPPVIDGELDEDAWKTATALRDFYQVQPGDNIAPSESTDVFLGYDADALYIGFRAYGEPDKVRATIAKRDAIFDDDHVGIYLDTFNDQRKAYELFFNPFGIQHDGIHSGAGDDDYSVDVVMESQGKIGQDGYTVEVRIPFKSLRYEVGKGKLWGVHAVRRIKWRNNELDSWMPLSRNITGKLSQAGHITGLENLSTDRTLEIMPNVTIAENGKRIRATPIPPGIGNPGLAPDRFVNKPVGAEFGLTMKLHLTPDIILDFTANPDFAQIEADQPVVTANERFPIFFEEKRPFFLEGIDIFQTPLQPVHTRTIVDPQFAFKLTGKEGRSTFGVLLASDKAPGEFSDEERNDPALIPIISPFLDKNAYTGVLRFKRDVGQESNVGLIATSRNFIQRHNQVGGFDGRFRMNRQTFLSFQLLGTTARQFFFDPNLGDDVYRTSNGFGYYWKLNRTGRHLNVNLNGSGRTRHYVADVGFTRRTNTNQQNITIAYNSEPKPQAKLISWTVSTSGYVNFDWQGRGQTWEQDPSISFNFARESNVTLTAFIGQDRAFEEEFGPKRTETRPGTFIGDDSQRRVSQRGIDLAFASTPSKAYSFSFRTWYGWNLFDFDFGAGPLFPRVSPAALIDPDAPLDPGPGDQWFTTLTVKYRPVDALGLSLDYTRSRLVRNDTNRVAFDSHIATLRTSYQFTRFTFARARIDYDSLQSNFKGQFLLGWAPNPGTSFYAGYNDDLHHNGFNPFTGIHEPGFRRNGRTFFIKASYLIRRKL